MQTAENQKLKLENERLQNQIDCLTEQVNRLVCGVDNVKIEPINVVFNKSEPTITQMITPAGYVKVGDVVCYDRCNKQLRFGTVEKFHDKTGIFLKNRYSVKFGEDRKSVV